MVTNYFNMKKCTLMKLTYEQSIRLIRIPEMDKE